MTHKYHFKDDLADIADICGEEVAVELVTKLPGIEVKIPAKFSETNPLAKIDRKIADILIEQFPGDKFYIPIRSDEINKADLIKSLHREGKQSLEIALAAGVSERYVREVISKAGKKPNRPHDPRQIDLEDFLKDQQLDD